MDNTEIVKKRLVDLKKLSQELKDSTGSESAPDLNIIKAIIDITKNPSPTKSPSLSNYLIEQSEAMSSPEISSPYKKKSSRILSRQTEKYSYQNQDPQYEPLFPENQRSSKSFLTAMMEMSGSMNNNNNNNNNNNIKNRQSQSPNSKAKNLSSHQQLSRVSSKNRQFNSHNRSLEEQDEIVELRRQNAELELKLKEMREKLAKYAEREEQEQIEGKVPYFQLNDELNIFLTRLKITDDDYQRIQYHRSEVQLTLDRLIVEKKSKASSKNQKNSLFFNFHNNKEGENTSQNRNSILATKHEELPFTELKEVQYINQRTLLLVFLDSSNMRANLFIEFDDGEELKRWDKGIYINFKIVGCLEKEKLFMLEKPNAELRNPTGIDRNSQKQKPPTKMKTHVFGQIDLKHGKQVNSYENNEEDEQEEDDPSPTLREKQILKKYLYQKQKYHGIQKQLKETWLQKIDNVKKKRLEKSLSKSKVRESGGSESKEKIIEKSRESKQEGQKKNVAEVFIDESFSKDSPKQIQETSQRQQRQQRQSEIKDNRQSKKNQSDKIRPPPILKTVESKNYVQREVDGVKIRQVTSEIQEFPEGDHENEKDLLLLKMNEKKDQEESEQMKKKKQLQEEQARLREQEEKRQLQKIEQMKEEEKKFQEKKRMNDAMKVMKKGMFMIKYAKSAFSPHQKKVYIDEECKDLCWSDKGSKDKKSIPLHKITKVNKGEAGPGIEKHEKKETIEKNKLLYFIIHMNDKQRQMLEFGMKNHVLLDQFVDSLEVILTEVRKGL